MKILVTVYLFLNILFSSVSAKEIKMAVGLALPPYFIESENRGLELDIIRAALKTQGHTVKISFVPFKRINSQLSKNIIDCVSPILKVSGLKAFYSNSHISYQNFAMSLKNNNITIYSINDLGKNKIVAFQNATLYLGKEYKDVVSKNPKYIEKANQLTQVKLLYKKRADVVVSDINIFKFFSNKLNKKLTEDKIVKYHSIFPETKYTVAFNDKKLRDDFNKGLNIIKNNGLYSKIVEKYIGK